MTGRSRSVPDYKCRKCTSGEVRPLEGLSAETVDISNSCLMISAAGGVGESIVARIRCGWR